MKLKEAIEVLELHNRWRRGEEVEMTTPTLLGEAIDVVVEDYKTRMGIGPKMEKIVRKY